MQLNKKFTHGKCMWNIATPNSSPPSCQISLMSPLWIWQVFNTVVLNAFICSFCNTSHQHACAFHKKCLHQRIGTRPHNFFLLSYLRNINSSRGNFLWSSQWCSFKILKLFHVHSLWDIAIGWLFENVYPWLQSRSCIWQDKKDALFHWIGNYEIVYEELVQVISCLTGFALAFEVAADALHYITGVMCNSEIQTSYVIAKSSCLATTTTSFNKEANYSSCVNSKILSAKQIRIFMSKCKSNNFRIFLNNIISHYREMYC